MKTNKPMNRDVVYGMMLNALVQIADGWTAKEVNVNPDMENYDDYSLNEVIELAERYDDPYDWSRSTELLDACPECGASATIFTDGMRYRIVCNGCAKESERPSFVSLADAVTDWNNHCDRKEA